MLNTVSSAVKELTSINYLLVVNRLTAEFFSVEVTCLWIP